MQIAPFTIEQFFAQYEFTTPWILCASDCESMSIGDLLNLTNRSLTHLANLTLGYTDSQGDPLLRQQIATRYPGTTAEEIVVVVPEEGIFLTMHTLLQPGDHVVVLTPAYDSLLNLAEHLTGNVTRWEIKAEQGRWAINLEELESLITPQTRLLVVNFPHNPTGYLPTLAEFTAIIELARQHNIWLFCDEMYRGLEPTDEQTLPSAVTLYDRAIVLTGLSKVHGLPGLRHGWLIMRDAPLRAQLINWKHYTTICPPAPSDWLALAALEAESALVARNRGIIAHNLDVAESFFTRWPELFTWRPPLAGSVALVGLDVPSATVYCQQLAAEEGILLLPSSCLGYGDKHIRLGLGRRNFAEGLARYEASLQAR